MKDKVGEEGEGGRLYVSLSLCLILCPLVCASDSVWESVMRVV